MGGDVKADGREKVPLTCTACGHETEVSGKPYYSKNSVVRYVKVKGLIRACPSCRSPDYMVIGLVQGKLSELSEKRLADCHDDLKKIVHELVKEMPIGVICGFRGEAEQNAAFKRGTSKLKFPHSKHNKIPSLAVDIAPLPIDWEARGRFVDMREKFLEVASRLGIKIRTISWDLVHFELVE